MTVFSKKRFAFPNPDNGKEFLLKDQEFTYDLPEEIQADSYFKACVADGDIVVVDSPKAVDAVLQEGTIGKRNGKTPEDKPENIGIIDGGEAK